MRSSLQIKLISLVLLISFISFASLAFIFIKDYDIALKNSYIKEAQTIAYTLDANIRTKAELENKSLLLSNIHKHLWLNPDILEINVNLPNQQQMTTYISNNQLQIGKVADPENMISYQEDRLINKTIEISNQNILVVITPVHISGQSLGTYQINFSLEKVDQSISDKIITTILISSIVNLGFVTILFFLLRLVVINPIHKIRKGLHAIGKNNLNYELRIKSNDEIGSLARSFNNMRLDLKKSKNELENYSKTLENKIQERTDALEKKNKELERFNQLVVGRELKMLQLKKKIKILEAKNKPD